MIAILLMQLALGAREASEAVRSGEEASAAVVSRSR
jgi:hypothetical protein